MWALPPPLRNSCQFRNFDISYCSSATSVTHIKLMVCQIVHIFIFVFLKNSLFLLFFLTPSRWRFERNFAVHLLFWVPTNTRRFCSTWPLRKDSGTCEGNKLYLAQFYSRLTAKCCIWYRICSVYPCRARLLFTLSINSSLSFQND